MPDAVPDRATSTYADRGFRLLAHILDDAARAEVESLLFDPITRLPMLQLALRQIRSSLEGGRQVGLLALIVSPFTRLEEMFGWLTYERAVRTVAGVLEDVKGECLREDDSIAELSMSGNSFVFILSPPRQKGFVLYEDLGRVRDRVGQKLQEKLTGDLFPPEVASRFGCSIGCGVVQAEPGMPFERLVLRALDQAYSDAFRERDREFAGRVARLTRIVEHEELVAVYQPIVDLRAGTVLGYEAFTRGPKGDLEDPGYLFKLAYEAQLLWKLERVCRDKALAGVATLPEGALLFLNTEPDSIFDPQLQRSGALRALANRAVLEITERAAISDYALFRRALEVIRDMGLRVAIDDVGSAYSGLRLIAEVQPDFVKLDMTISADMGAVVKQDLVRTVARIAERLNAPLIVEGVETREQLDALLSVGIRYAQGFLFGPPRPDFAAVTPGHRAAAQ